MSRLLWLNRYLLAAFIAFAAFALWCREESNPRPDEEAAGQHDRGPPTFGARDALLADRFTAVESGMTREQVEEVLGPPESFERVCDWNQAIWRGERSACVVYYLGDGKVFSAGLYETDEKGNRLKVLATSVR